MKLLIITSSESTLKWASLKEKLSFITKALNSGKEANWTVEIKYVKCTPVIVDKRIDRIWLTTFFDEYYRQGYDVVGLHMSDIQRERGEFKGLCAAQIQIPKMALEISISGQTKLLSVTSCRNLNRPASMSFAMNISNRPD